MSELKRVLMARDELTAAQAQAQIDEAKLAVREGADPAEVLEEMFGLEPDYFFALLD
jgi:hypothetical protein